jgi:thioredoxin 1
LALSHPEFLFKGRCPVRHFIFVSLLVGLAGSSIYGQTKNKAPDGAKANLFQDLSYTDALKSAKSSKKVVMVEFALSTCGLCKAMDAKTFPDKQVQQFIKDKTVAIKITLDKDNDKLGPDLAKFVVGSIKTPTIIFIDSDGKEVGRTAGFLPAKDFLDKAKSFVK